MSLAVDFLQVLMRPPGLNYESPVCYPTTTNSHKKTSLNIPSYHPHKTITNENLEICFRFRFRNGKANKIPLIFFCICFCNAVADLTDVLVDVLFVDVVTFLL